MRPVIPSAICINSEEYTEFSADSIVCKMEPHITMKNYDYILFSIFFPKDKQKSGYEKRRLCIAKIYGFLYINLYFEDGKSFLEFTYEYEPVIHPGERERKYALFVLNDFLFEQWNHFFVCIPAYFTFSSFFKQYFFVYHNFNVVNCYRYDLTNYTYYNSYVDLEIGLQQKKVLGTKNSVEIFPFSFYMGYFTVFNYDFLNYSDFEKISNNGLNVARNLELVKSSFPGIQVRFSEQFENFAVPDYKNREWECTYHGNCKFVTSKTLKPTNIVFPVGYLENSEKNEYIKREVKSNYFVSKGVFHKDFHNAWIKNLLPKALDFYDLMSLDNTKTFYKPVFKSNGNKKIFVLETSKTVTYTETYFEPMVVSLEGYSGGFYFSVLGVAVIESTNFSIPKIENAMKCSCYEAFGNSVTEDLTLNPSYFSYGPEFYNDGGLMSNVEFFVTSVVSEHINILFYLPNFTSNSGTKQVGFRARIVVEFYQM